MKKGFTLIELLVAISIVAVISIIGLTSYQGTILRGRDSVRKTDLKNLAAALEIYYQGNRQFIGTPQSDGTCLTSVSEFYSQIAPKMIGLVPTDPKTNQRYLYTAEKKCQSFRLFGKLENCTDAEIIPGVSCQTAWNYSVVSDDLRISPAP